MRAGRTRVCYAVAIAAFVLVGCLTPRGHARELRVTNNDGASWSVPPDKGSSQQPSSSFFETRADQSEPAQYNGFIIVSGVFGGEDEEDPASVEGVEKVTTVSKYGIKSVKLQEGVNPAEVAVKLQMLAGVLLVEPDWTVRAADPAPEIDPLHDYGNLWGLDRIGAGRAWETTTGSPGMVVCVIDTGIDYTHPDLQQNLWRNPGETGEDKEGRDKASNGVDDDDNGYIDDVFGIDVTTDLPEGMGDPWDNNGHGTHCAGTVGAVGRNGMGVVGVNHDVSIMGCKFLDLNGQGSISGALACLEYAMANGANLTSNSYSGAGYNTALEAMLGVAEALGQPYIAAAGNDAKDNDANPTYPSSFVNNIVTSVGSTNKADELSSFTNWGRDSVDLAAPGTDIMSTVPGEGYTYLSGTSMATPHVAGAYALLWSLAPHLTADELKSLVMASGREILALYGKTVSGRRLDLAAAVAHITDGERFASLPQLPAYPLPAVPVQTFSSLTTLFDLELAQVTFQYIPEAKTYSWCVTPGGAVQGFPISPEGGEELSLGDDDSVLVAGINFTFFGFHVDAVHVSSNGYLTFLDPAVDLGGAEWTTAAGPPRVAPLAMDLVPDEMSSVSYKRLPGLLAVTYLNVRQFGEVYRQSFQVVLSSGGAITFSYGQVEGQAMIVGLSGGYAVDSPGVVALSSQTCDGWSQGNTGPAVSWATATPTPASSGGSHHIEEFPGGKEFDLLGHTVVFTPVDDGSSYSICSHEGGEWLPTNSTGTFSLFLGDDDYGIVSLAGLGFGFFGVTYSEAFVGSNGYITFGAFDTSFSTSFFSTDEPPRISALFCDLSPDESSTISWLLGPNKAVVTWEDVKTFGTDDRQSMQVTLHMNGTVTIMYIRAETTARRFVGLSTGAWPEDALFEDLSAQLCFPDTVEATTAMDWSPYPTAWNTPLSAAESMPIPTLDWAPHPTVSLLIAAEYTASPTLTQTLTPTATSTVTLPDQPPVEELLAFRPLDLIGRTVVFQPMPDLTYTSCAYASVDWVPTTAPGSQTISLGDDDYAEMQMAGLGFVFFGVPYSSVYVGSNGYLTFGAPDLLYSGTVDNHFALPRVSALFCDLTPDETSTVSWLLEQGRVVVTWEEVRAFGTELRQSMQVALYQDGRISISYLKAQATSARVVGLSAGAAPAEFESDDLDSEECVEPTPAPTATPTPTPNTTLPKQPPVEELLAFRPLDLIGHTVVFQPMPDLTYTSCAYTSVDWVPTTASGSQTLSLGDDDYAEMQMAGLDFSFFGLPYHSVYVGSNGYLTFGAPDLLYSGTVDNHFALPRVSALFCDLTPDETSTVSWLLEQGRVVVTWEEVRAFGTELRQSMQVALYQDGRISISYLKAQATSARVVGLSAGAAPAEFISDDLDSEECIGMTPAPTSDWTPAPSLPPASTITPTPTPTPTYDTPAPTAPPPPQPPMEIFPRGAAFDLSGSQVVYTYDPENAAFAICLSHGHQEFPEDPTPAVPLYLTDDSFEEISGGFAVQFFAQTYTSVWVSSNGFVSLEEPVAGGVGAAFLLHLDVPLVAALYADLVPDVYSDISWMVGMDGGLVVTWQNLKQYADPDKRNSFQLSLGADGSVSVTYLRVDSDTMRVVGFNSGLYSQEDIETTDLSTSSKCVLSEPTASPTPAPTPGPVQLSVEDVLGEEDGVLRISVSLSTGGISVMPAISSGHSEAVIQKIVQPGLGLQVSTASITKENFEALLHGLAALGGLLASGDISEITSEMLLEAVLAAGVAVDNGNAGSTERRRLLQGSSSLSISTPSSAFSAAFSANVKAQLGLSAQDSVVVSTVVSSSSGFVVVLWSMALRSRCYLCDLRSQSSSATDSDCSSDGDTTVSRDDLSETSSSEENFPAASVSDCSAAGNLSFEVEDFPWSFSQSQLDMSRSVCEGVSLPHSSEAGFLGYDEHHVLLGSSAVEKSKRLGGPTIQLPGSVAGCKRMAVGAGVVETIVNGTVVVLPLASNKR